MVPADGQYHHGSWPSAAARMPSRPALEGLGTLAQHTDDDCRLSDRHRCRAPSHSDAAPVRSPHHGRAGLLSGSVNASAMRNARDDVSANEIFDVTATTIWRSGNIMRDATLPPLNSPS